LTSTGYSDWGEEWKQLWAYRQDNVSRDTSLEILLYNDSTDSISDSDDVGAVNTEPGTAGGGDAGNYTRQSVTLDSSDVTLTQESGEIQAQMVVTFDVTDTTGTVDSAMAVNDFTSTVVGSDGSATTHHIWSSDIGEADLSNYTGNFEVTINVLEDD
jgi:hypothetical protein